MSQLNLCLTFLPLFYFLTFISYGLFTKSLVLRWFPSIHFFSFVFFHPFYSCCHWLSDNPILFCRSGDLSPNSLIVSSWLLCLWHWLAVTTSCTLPLFVESFTLKAHALIIIWYSLPASALAHLQQLHYVFTLVNDQAQIKNYDFDRISCYLIKLHQAE